MVLDDIEVPGNSMTELMREKLLQLCTEAESILTPKDDSRILFLGTPRPPSPYIVNSPNVTIVRSYGRALPERSRKLRRFARPTLQEDCDNGAIPGDPTDPDRFNDLDLLEREASMGRSNFMLQFMLDTSLSDAEKFPLKCADLIVTAVNPTTCPDQIIWS